MTRPVVLLAVAVGLAASASSAAASTTVGRPAEALIAGEKEGCVASIQCTYYQAGGSFTEPEAPAYTVPFDGMIVRWRLGDGSSGNPVRLRVLRPTAGKFVGAGTGSLVTALTGVNVFENERLPVKAGDTIGLDNENSALVFGKPGLEIAFIDFFMPFLPDGGPAASPSGEFSVRRLEMDADVVGLPTSTGVAAPCPGGSGATVTVTADTDPTDRPKAVRFKVDGGTEQAVATTSENPGVASIPLPSGVHSLEFWGEDLLGQQEATHHQLRAGCTVPAAPLQTGAPPAKAALISAARQSASRWREGNLLARISAVPVGTTFSFNLNQAANATMTFTQRASGRKVGGACVAPSGRNRGKPRCTRTFARGALAFAGHAGTNAVGFQGRISRTRKLKPGRYTVVIGATNTAGQHSTPAHLSFTIVSH